MQEKIYFIGEKKFDDFEEATAATVLEYFKNSKCISLDTETEGFNPYFKKLLLYQLGDDKTAFVIDQKVLPIETFKDLLEEKELLIHNAQFDLKFLFYHGIYPTKIWDTFLAECVKYQGLESTQAIMVGLKEVAYNYCQVLLDKSVRGAIHRGVTKEVIEYSAKDVLYLEKIADIQKQWHKDNGTYNTVLIENLHVNVLAEISLHGCEIDINGWKKQADEAIAQLKDVELEFDNFLLDKDKSYYKPTNVYRSINYKTGKVSKKTVPFSFDLFNPDAKPNRLTDVNWASEQQVGTLLAKLYGTRIIDKEGKVTTNSTYVEINVKKRKRDLTNPPFGYTKEEIQSEIDFCEILIKHRELSKLISTYGHKFLEKYIYPDNRVRTTFWQVRSTGRVSSGSNKNNMKSPNLQNIPQHFRNYFIAPRGYKFITLDYSSIEPRNLADKSKDPALLDFIINGDGDMHSFVASRMYTKILGKPVVITSKEPYIDIGNQKINARQTAKAINLGLNYGKTAYTLKEDLLCSQEEAQEFIDLIKGLFPRNEQYFKFKYKQTMQQGYILTNSITGRRVYIENFDYIKELIKKGDNKELHTKKELSDYYKAKGSIERMCKNYPVQGTAADILKLASYFVFRYIKYRKLDAYIANVVHDEINIICKEEIAEKLDKVSKLIMTNTAKIFCKTVPFPVESHIAQHWSK